MEKNPHIWKILAGLALSVFLSVVSLLLLPYVVNVYEKYSVLKSQNEQIEYMGNWREQLTDIESKQKQLKEGIDKMYVSLSEEGEFSTVIKQVFDEANSSYVSINKIQPVSEENDGLYQKKTGLLEVQGSYHSLARFINKLEQSGLMIEVQDLEFSGSEKPPGILEGTVNIEITLLRDSR